MIHCIRKVAFSIVAAVVSLSVAASITDLPVKTINGKRYYYYEVQPKETVYSLCRRLNISREDMIKANPAVADGLKAGQTLVFPVESVGSHRNTTSYMVQKDETGYGISRKYNMTLDEFYQLNPSAKDGLKAGQFVQVYVSSTAPEVKTADHTSASDGGYSIAPDGTHSIAPGETLYQIARDNDLTLQQLLDANPSLDASSYAAGQVIVIPSKANGVHQSSPSKGNTYEVKEGDTFYGIAHRHGISVDQLRAANSAIDILQPGMLLDLPQGCDVESTVAAAGPDLIGSPVIPAVPFARDTLVIAVAMPFNIGGNSDSRSTQATEFLRGFVLAIDSLRNQGTPVRLVPFDSKTSEADAKAVLADSRMKKANVIVAPSVASQIDLFSKFAEKNKIYLINLFGIKDQTYKTNPYMMNANIPHDAMYAKAIDYYVTRYPDVTPVFIKRKGGKDDKAEFVTLFKEALNAKGTKYHEIEYVDKLSEVTLNKLPGGRSYAFIPNTSNIAEFQTFADAVIKYRDANLDQGSASLWGYPEWLKIRGENLKKLHNANTLIFSRFYAVEKDDNEELLQDKFQKWYGVRISDKAPKSGTLGFDTGMFLLNALSHNGGDFKNYTPSYDGLQNGYNFVRVPDGGWVNNEMFIINFAPGEFISKYGI